MTFNGNPVYEVEDIEELGTKLERAEFSATAATEWRVFDDCDIEIDVPRSTKGVATERTEIALVRSGTACKIDGDTEVRSVGSAPAEIIGWISSTGRKLGHQNQIRAIGSAGAGARS
jgi:hypothetical protein